MIQYEKHIFHFNSEAEFNQKRQNDYVEPWLSYTETRGTDFNEPVILRLK